MNRIAGWDFLLARSSVVVGSGRDVSFNSASEVQCSRVHSCLRGSSTEASPMPRVGSPRGGDLHSFVVAKGLVKNPLLPIITL